SSATYVGASGPYTLQNWNYSNLVLSTGATTVTYNLPAALSVGGNLLISSGTLDTTASNYPITIGGNWMKSVDGIFNANNSTVTFNGSGAQQLSGSTTFYGLQALTPNATLQFTVGSTNYVTNMVEFRNVGLISTGASGTTWYFTYTGSSQTLVDLHV